MDFLHTDPATGDQYSLSVSDGEGMPSFAERQAAVAQYRAVTQGTQAAGAQAASGYGYAPLNSGNASAQASAPSSGSGGGYGQDAWNPPSWAGLGYGGFGDGGSYGSYPFQVPQPYSGDPNNSPALQMLRARAAEAAQRQAAAPPVSPVMLPKAASGQDATAQGATAGDGASTDPWSWQNWLLGNQPEEASSGIPSVGTSSWLDWLQNTEPQAQDDAAKPTLPATSTPAQVDVGTLPVDKPGAPATPQPIPVDGFPGLKYTMTMMPVPREETSSPLQTTAGRAVTGGTATPGAAASADSGWGNSMPGQALGGSASPSAGTFFTGPMPSLDTGAMPGTAGTGPFSRASSQPATGQTGGNPSANHPSAGEVEAQRLYGRPLTPVERSLASRLTPQEVRDRIGSTQPVAQPVGRPPANGEIRAAPHNSFVPFGARTGQPFGDFADSLRQAWTLDRAGYAPNTNAIDRYVRPLVDDVAATVGQYTTIPANYVQGALAAGLRRYDAVAADLPSSTNPFSNALTESGYLFDTGDGAQGEIAARDMTGARRIGESVPELGENTVAGTLYNGGVRAGLDPTNFLFAPEKAISMPVTVAEALERARLAEEGAGTVAQAQALYNTATAGPSLAERAYTGVSGAVKAGAVVAREYGAGVRDSWEVSRGRAPLWDGAGNRVGYVSGGQPEPFRWTRPLKSADPNVLKQVGPTMQAGPFAPPAADFMPSVSETTSPAMLQARLEIARAQARQAARLNGVGQTRGVIGSGSVLGPHVVIDVAGEKRGLPEVQAMRPSSRGLIKAQEQRGVGEQSSKVGIQSIGARENSNIFDLNRLTEDELYKQFGIKFRPLTHGNHCYQGGYPTCQSNVIAEALKVNGVTDSIGDLPVDIGVYMGLLKPDGNLLPANLRRKNLLPEIAQAFSHFGASNGLRAIVVEGNLPRLRQEVAGEKITIVGIYNRPQGVQPNLIQRSLGIKPKIIGGEGHAIIVEGFSVDPETGKSVVAISDPAFIRPYNQDVDHFRRRWFDAGHEFVSISKVSKP